MSSLAFRPSHATTPSSSQSRIAIVISTGSSSFTDLRRPTGYPNGDDFFCGSFVSSSPTAETATVAVSSVSRAGEPARLPTMSEAFPLPFQCYKPTHANSPFKTSISQLPNYQAPILSPPSIGVFRQPESSSPPRELLDLQPLCTIFLVSSRSPSPAKEGSSYT